MPTSSSDHDDLAEIEADVARRNAPGKWVDADTIGVSQHVTGLIVKVRNLRSENARVRGEVAKWKMLAQDAGVVE